MEEIRELNNQDEKKKKIEQLIQKRIRSQIMICVVSVFLILVLVFAMTAAWFTNVAKTSDLVFETESWGFDEEKITLAEEHIKIAPGKSGIIPLTIDNSDAMESVQIGVTISKASETVEMEEEIQKRLYFYVDAPRTVVSAKEIEGQEEPEFVEETTERTYLASSAPHSYTYTILPGQQLIMNETYYNDLPLKWEWVYDMLGYYFRGTVNPEAEEKVIIDEYVRPIEYDYSSAVFEIDEESEKFDQLVTIGKQTAEKFLTNLSKNDGYAGTIDVETAVLYDGKVYYPVEVDDTGYGMWAYLCTWTEIKEAVEFDKSLANPEESILDEDTPITATVVLTAHNVPAQIESVNTEAALKDALLKEDVDIIELSSDILSGSTIQMESGNKVINLNGYTLQYSGFETEYNFVTVSDGASLTVMNGLIDGTSVAEAYGSAKIKAFETVAGNLMLSNVEVTDFDAALYVNDMLAEKAGDSTVQITNCDLKTKQAVMVIQGNGDATDAMTKVIIYGSSLSSEYYVGISGQGNDDRWGTEMVIAESEISGCYGALYHPQRSSTTMISNCKLSGNTGVAIKGGTVTIETSEIIGTGAVAVDTAAAAGSGFVDTGDAVYVEAVYNWPVTVNLKGENTVISEKAYAVELFGQEDKGPGKISIFEGTYQGEKGAANWNEFGNFEIFAGTYQGKVKDTITRFDVSEE